MPRQGDFLVTFLSRPSGWMCSAPAVLRLLQQESPFSHLEAVSLPPTFRRSTAAPLLLHLLGAARLQTRARLGSWLPSTKHPFRVEIIAPREPASSYLPLTTAGSKTSFVC